MTDHDWQCSDARQVMLASLASDEPLPPIGFDEVLCVWFASAHGCLLTRSEILTELEHAQDDRKMSLLVALANLDTVLTTSPTIRKRLTTELRFTVKRKTTRKATRKSKRAVTRKTKKGKRR